MSNTTEHATVTTACEVSFQVGNMDYGTINVPVGTKCFRHIVKSRDAEWKPETVKVSDWFVSHDDMVKLCPESHKLFGRPSPFFLHDASHYGITMPNANVRKDEGATNDVAWTPVAKHRSFHY